jgi:hydroxymethylpyrimidine/phosphomethylpyrimidine kinase
VQATALTIAGSDPSGGAGIQADLKTFHQFGVYGQAAITLLTVQNTQGVSRVVPMEPELILQQVRSVFVDIPPKAIKTGALGSPEVVEAVAALARESPVPVVIDPVMISKHGHRLLSPSAEEVLRRQLVPCGYLVTPNLPEAEALTGIEITSEAQVRKAAEKVLSEGCKAVLIKGGHSTGEPVDYLITANDFVTIPGKRVHTPHTHGTGCTYSAAITAGLALGMELKRAVFVARDYIQAAIGTAPGLGQGCGPVNFFAPVSFD